MANKSLEWTSPRKTSKKHGKRPIPRRRPTGQYSSPSNGLTTDRREFFGGTTSRVCEEFCNSSAGLCRFFSRRSLPYAPKNAGPEAPRATPVNKEHGQTAKDNVLCPVQTELIGIRREFCSRRPPTFWRPSAPTVKRRKLPRKTTRGAPSLNSPGAIWRIKTAAAALAPSGRLMRKAIFPPFGRACAPVMGEQEPLRRGFGRDKEQKKARPPPTRKNIVLLKKSPTDQSVLKTAGCCMEFSPSG